MANEAITNATAWTLLSDGWLVHPAESGDRTAPSPVTNLALSSATASSATVTFTVPTEDDFSVVELSAVSQAGGTTVSASSATSPATISGLTPAHLYSIVAVAKDTSGNRSTPASVLARTQGKATPDIPLNIYWYVNRQAEDHALSPWPIDAEAPLESGKLESPRIQLHAGQVNDLRIRGICSGPVRHIEIAGLGLTYEARPELRPLGRSLS